MEGVCMTVKDFENNRPERVSFQSFRLRKGEVVSAKGYVSDANGVPSTLLLLWNKLGQSFARLAGKGFSGGDASIDGWIYKRFPGYDIKPLG